MIDASKGSARRHGGYALAILAVLTCPCHLPVLALLLSGTAAGALVSEHFGVALAVMAILFLLSLTTAMRLLQGLGADKE